MPGLNTVVANVVVGPETPPPTANNLVWVSTALADARFPQHPGDTQVVLDGGTSTAMQEPNVWTYQNAAYILVNYGGAQFVFRKFYGPDKPLDDPSVPWTNLGQVLGNGFGGEASPAVHAGLYVEGTDLYAFYVNSNSSSTTLFVARSNMATPTVWAKLGAVLTKTGGVLNGLSGFGNSAVFKDTNGVYTLLFEGLFGSASDGWLTGMAECASISGTYTVVAGNLPSLSKAQVYGTTLAAPYPVPTNGFLEGQRAFYSCGPVVYENGQYVQLFHGGEVSSGDTTPQSEIYRATSKNKYLWQVDLYGYPVHRRNDHRWEIDQCADIFPVNIDGVWWGFWTAASNQNGRFVVKMAPLSPTTKVYSGGVWVALHQQGGDGSSTRGLRERTRYAISGQPLYPFDDVAIDPGTTVGFGVVLPYASKGCEVRMANTAAATGTIAVTAQSGDTILGVNAAITVGQLVTYKCLRQGFWCRSI